jgi:hypothetical protein
MSRSGFAAVFLLTREAHERGHVIEPGRVETIMRLFDRLDRRQSKAALRLWMRDDGYRAAVDALAESYGSTKRGRV